MKLPDARSDSCGRESTLGSFAKIRAYARRTRAAVISLQRDSLCPYTILGMNSRNGETRGGFGIQQNRSCGGICERGLLWSTQKEGPKQVCELLHAESASSTFDPQDILAAVQDVSVHVPAAQGACCCLFLRCRHIRRFGAVPRKPTSEGLAHPHGREQGDLPGTGLRRYKSCSQYHPE